MATKKTAAGKTAGKRSGTKTAAKKTAAKKTSAKKTSAKKTATKKTAAKKTDTTYTKPELRERLKRRITAGTKGGRAGQWSARKAQLLAHEYEAAGGGYAGGRGDAQRHLGEWTAEHWKTSDAKPARRAGGTTRYLPEKAWEQLTPAEREATNRKKVAGSKRGRQFVANTGAAKSARKSAGKSARKSAAKSAGRPAAR